MKTTKSLFGILTITAALAVQVDAQTFLTNGLVAYYPFNGNANDASGNGNNGTLNNVSFVSDRFGSPNRAGVFAGNSGSNVQINAANLNLPPDFTVSVWINYAAGAGTEGPRIISTAGYEITTDSTFVTQRHINFNNTFAPGSGFANVSSSNGVPAGVWTQVVGVRVGSKLNLYINGSPAGSVSVALPPDYSRGVVPKIGGNSGANTDNYAGLIDDIRIYNRALSASEVQQLFVYESPKLTDGLVAYYPFNGNANDASGNGNNGTPQNGTTFSTGKVGQALSLDGVDDQVLVLHNANQNTGSQITIDAWVNPSSSGHGRTILQKRSASNVGGYHFETLGQPFGPDNGLQFVIMFGGTLHGCLTTNSVLTINTWQHVAATYDGSAMRIYVNGVERASAAVSGAIDAVTDPIVIGRNVVVPADHAWRGLIDEVDLFNRALSSSEVAQLYAYERPCSPHKATATATIVNGFLVGATITDTGCGYTNPPTVLIQGGGGNGATATAVVSGGQVSAINVISAGCCYDNAPAIVIGSPPFVPTVSIRVSKVEVTQNVVLGRNYVLESSFDLVTWTATGPPFTAESETIVTEFDVDVTGRFFRIRQVP